MPLTSVQRCVALLDRDGTINHDCHYLRRVEDMVLLPRAVAGLALLQSLGVRRVVVTNQSAIGRGMLDEDGLNRIHQRMRDLLASEGVALDGIYHCPHVPEDRCACRKPLPGMVLRAAAELGFDPRDAFAIGDKACDIELGASVGATTILVRTGYGRAQEPLVKSTYVVDDLLEAAQLVQRCLEGSSERAKQSAEGV